MDLRPSWVGDVDEPAVAVLQSNNLSRMARRENQISEEVTKINQRVDRMIQTFERTPGIEMSMNSPDLEILEDMDELQNILRDRNQKRKYQQKVTVFIVGYQETCGQRRHLLTQLQEFFSLYSKLSEEREDVHPDVSGVDLDGVAAQMTGALRSAEAAISRLVDIHKEIMDSVGQRLSARAAGKRTIKKLEKAVSQAKGDIMKLTEQLVQAQEDLSSKDQQMKDLLKQHEMKVLEINYFKGQLEDTKANLRALHSETATQRSLLDAELRKQASRLEELEIQVAGKGGQSKDTSTQWEVLNSTFVCEVGDVTEQIKEKEHERLVTDESPSRREKQFTEKAVQTDSIDEGNVLSAHPPDSVDVSSCSKPSVGGYEEDTPAQEYEEDTPAQSEDLFIILGAGHTAVITLCPLRAERKCVITSVQASEDSKLLITSQTSSEMNLHSTTSQATNPDTFYSPVASHPEEDPGNSKNPEISLNDTMLSLTDNTTTAPAVSLKEPDGVVPFLLPEGQSDACLLHSDIGKVDDGTASNGNELHNNTLLARSLPTLIVNKESSCLLTSFPVLNKNGRPIDVTDSISSQINRDANTDKSLSDDSVLLGDFSSDHHHVPDTSLPGPDQKHRYITPVCNTGISVTGVQTLLQGFTSLGHDETPVRRSLESELGLNEQSQDPAPGEEKGIQTERPHHIEGADPSGLNVVRTEETHDELRQVSQRLQRFIQEIQHLLMRSGCKSLAADLNVGVSSLNEDAISVTLTQLEHIPTVLSSLLRWDGVTRHEKKKQRAGECFQNGNNTTGPQGALLDRELLAWSEPDIQRPLDVSVQRPIADKTNVFRTPTFSQHDEEHNKRILKRAARHGRIPLHAFQDACRGMSQYRLLMQERLQSLVRGYMLYVSWDRAQVLLKRRQKTHASDTLSNLHKTKQQSMVRWRQQRTRSQEERLSLLDSLNQMFHGLQEKSGIFLIRPVQSWPGSSAAMETDRQTHFPRRPFLKSNWNLSSASKEQVRESLTCCGKTRSPALKEWTFPHSHTEPRPLVITPKLLEMDVHRYLCNECCVMSQIYSPSTCFSLRSSAPLRSIQGVQRTPPYPAL